MTRESGRNLASGAFSAAVPYLLTWIVMVCGFGAFFGWALTQTDWDSVYRWSGQPIGHAQ